MVNANELRISNLVNFVNRTNPLKRPLQTLLVIQEISQIHVKTSPFGTSLHQVLRYDEFNIKDIEPIPLTEEWVKKFLFVKDEEYDSTFNLPLSAFNGFTTITIDVRAEILLLDLMEIKIKYVHQLQNLYFALTGNELKMI